MEQYLPILIFFIFGLAGGFMGGLLGVGGGVIFVPILTHYLREMGVEGDVLVKCVLANSLLTIIFTGVAASYNQYKQGTYYIKPVLYTAVAGVFSSAIVTWLITTGTWYNKQRFSLIFIAILLLVSLRTFTKRKSNGDSVPIDSIPPIKLSATGFGAGIVSALSGLGGGLIVVAALNMFLKIDLKKSISISTGAILFFALPITLLYIIRQPASFPQGIFHLGHLVPQLVLPMGIGVVIASKYGVRMSAKLQENQLKLLMLILVLTVTTKMLFETFVH